MNGMNIDDLNRVSLLGFNALRRYPSVRTNPEIR